ncbi:6888_t:CDS:2 [Gigaspora margarita]|uniref:6888_t:CDS:1 n=1 Tax=Gigaspora margarita TaxID=4874 RepID=A0ABM8VY17_GIGMA|nr:6888_t:CDS:2 [Gigaspora margarita]
MYVETAVLRCTYENNSESKKRDTKFSQEIKLDEVRKELLKNDDNYNDSYLYMGTNCCFLNFKSGKVKIDPKDEYKFRLSDIIEDKDDNCCLYISQNAEFDLTALKFEKGLKLDDDEIKEYECNHEITKECKRSFIFEGNLPVVGLSHENSDQQNTYRTTKTRLSCRRVRKGEITISNLRSDIEANDDFKKEVRNALSEGTTQDKKNKLLEVSKKYGDFYARSLILGGTKMLHEEFAQNSGGPSRVNKTNIQAKSGVDTKSFVEIFGHNVQANAQANAQANYAYDNENRDEETIGGTGENIKAWIDSLEYGINWKIIGYDNIFSLFELLDETLRNKVLDVLGHNILKVEDIRNIGECNILASIVSENDNVFSLHVEYMNGDKNLPVFVVHNIQDNYNKHLFEFLIPETVKIELHWIIVGSPTNFNSIQSSSWLKSEKLVPVGVDNCIINNCGNIGTCVLEINNNINQIESSSNNLDAEHNTYDINKHNPYRSSYAIGNMITSTDTVDMHTMCGEEEINWKKGNNGILYGENNFNLENNLILVNQKCTDCTNCEHHGFVNIISGKIIYVSLNQNSSDFDGLVIYFKVPSRAVNDSRGSAWLQNCC